ncbi:MAG TPA: CHAT domain-containing protein, partial [Gemmataceae bacterium]
MADLRLTIAEDAASWQLTWSLDGRSLADTPMVPANATRALHRLGRELVDAFSARSADGFARLPFVPASAVRDVGRELFDLCCKPVWDGVQLDGGGHRLMVQSRVPAALNLPWELLPLAADGGPVGCDPAWRLYRTPLADVLDAGRPDRPGPLRILFLAAAPEDQHALDYEKEEDAILKATATLRGVVLHTADLGTFDELADLVKQVRPHVVHLSGHGRLGDDGAGVFCFEDDAGRTDARTARDLAERVFHGSTVQCVFLNGCETAQAAVAGLCQGLVTAGVPLALGWAASVADDRATNFAERFYHELAAGEPVPAAVALARLRIQKEGVRPHAAQGEDAQELTFVLPQLYAAAPIEQLFDPDKPAEKYIGPKTEYELLKGGVVGLREGFVGRRREQQRLVPALRTGETLFVLLHGMGGQGKSTLATRIAGRLKPQGFRFV